MALDRTQLDEIILRAFGANPSGYEGVFKQGQERLGQFNNGAIDQTQMGTAVHNMGRAFIQAYLQKTGQTPTDDMVKEFVGSNLNSSVAAKAIEGAPEGYYGGVASRGVEGMALPEQTAPVTNDPTLPQSQVGYLDQYMENALGRGRTEIEDIFNKERGRAIDEAGGRSRQPAFRNVLNEIDTRKGNAFSDLVSSLAAQEGQLGFGAEQRAREFGVTSGLDKQRLGLENRRFSEQVRQFDQGGENDLANRRYDEHLASKLGRLQADSGGDSALDWANVGIGAAGLIAAPFTGGASLGISSLAQGGLALGRQAASKNKGGLAGLAPDIPAPTRARMPYGPSNNLGYYPGM